MVDGSKEVVECELPPGVDLCISDQYGGYGLFTTRNFIANEVIYRATTKLVPENPCEGELHSTEAHSHG